MKSTSPSGEKFSYIDIDAIDNKKNIAFPKLILTESAPSRASRYTQYGDTLFSMVRPYLKNIAKVPTEHCIASTGFYICHPYSDINTDFIYYLMTSDYVVNGLNSFIKGDNSPSISSRDIDEWKFPLPPVAEQQRIVDEIDKYFSLINSIENEDVALKDSVKKAKSKVLELALSGKLTSDTSHYPKLPEGWEYKRLDEVLDYEQPQKYIVESTEYSDDYTTPVLTAGKSFIIGYTNERSGICTDVPVIIFDDFTTDSKFVDFPFKVKSSAMKILHPKGDINLKYLAYFMFITRLVGTTHKRYWISEYSKIKVPVPPKEEQDKIVSLIGRYYSLLDSIFMEQS